MKMKTRFFDIMRELTDAKDAFIEYTDNNGVIHILIDDLIGFDKNWEGICRDYNRPDLVDALFNLLDHAISKTEGMYPVYTFEGFTVCVGYHSYDI